MGRMAARGVGEMQHRRWVRANVHTLTRANGPPCKKKPPDLDGVSRSSIAQHVGCGLRGRAAGCAPRKGWDSAVSPYRGRLISTACGWLRWATSMAAVFTRHVERGLGRAVAVPATQAVVANTSHLGREQCQHAALAVQQRHEVAVAPAPGPGAGAQGGFEPGVVQVAQLFRVRSRGANTPAAWMMRNVPPARRASAARLDAGPISSMSRRGWDRRCRPTTGAAGWARRVRTKVRWPMPPLAPMTRARKPRGKESSVKAVVNEWSVQRVGQQVLQRQRLQGAVGGAAQEDWRRDMGPAAGRQRRNAQHQRRRA